MSPFLAFFFSNLINVLLKFKQSVCVCVSFDLMYRFSHFLRKKEIGCRYAYQSFYMNIEYFLRVFYLYNILLIYLFIFFLDILTFL
jgi:hypothetical protein